MGKVRAKSKTKTNAPVRHVSTRFVRIVHHQHTGRKLSIHYTSYAILFFLLTLTGAALLFASGNPAKADITESGDINVSAIVPGPPPTIPAVVTSPANQQHFSESVIDVEGTCETDKIIEVYRYSSFAGSTFCNGAGTFKLSITLLPGENDLKVRTTDAFGQYGPDSEVVIVYYDVPAEAPVQPRSPANPTAPEPLVVYTKPVYEGINLGQTLKVDYEIDGGTPAYAVSINWGDNTRHDLISLDKAGDYSASHKYRRSGQLVLTISATDKLGREALIQAIVVVNQRAATSLTSSSACQSSPDSINCRVSSGAAQFIENLWPAFTVACLMTVSFWFGERIVYSRLVKRPKHTNL